MDGADKVTYNHSDSYPDFLGKRLLEYVADTSTEQLREVGSRIVLVDGIDQPTNEMITRYKKHADLGVSKGTFQDWYCLLRNTQGDLHHYNNGLRHMIDNSSILADSQFCEWAYIANLADEVFEVYRGLNKKAEAEGRYAHLEVEDNMGYKGVRLIGEIPLLNIQPESIDEFVSQLNDLGTGKPV